MQRICTSLSNDGKKILLVGRFKKESPSLKALGYDQHRIKCFFNKGFLFYAEYNLRLFSFLIRHSSKAVCAVDLDTLLASYLASRISKKLLVFDAHELFVETPELESRNFVKSIWKWIANKILPGVKYNMTVSASVAKYYENAYNQQYKIIRNVPVSRGNGNQLRQQDLILYQGVMNKGRGLEILIKVISQRTDCKLWIVGEGDLSKDLRALTATLNCGNVVFKGYVEPNKLYKYTQLARVGVNLLEDKSKNYYYSLANKFFDYVHAESPMICMKFPEYEILNQDYEVAYLISTLDESEINKALDKLLFDHSYYSKLQANCKKAKMDWNWENEQKKLLEFYANILS
jgi:glycosyltransferase involved in cell wall biosynthesis